MKTQIKAIRLSRAVKTSDRRKAQIFAAILRHLRRERK